MRNLGWTTSALWARLSLQDGTTLLWLIGAEAWSVQILGGYDRVPHHRTPRFDAVISARRRRDAVVAAVAMRVKRAVL